MPYYIEAVDLYASPEVAAERSQHEGSGKKGQAFGSPIGLMGPYRSMRGARRALLEHQDCHKCRPTGRILHGSSHNDRLTVVAVENAASGIEQ